MEILVIFPINPKKKSTRANTGTVLATESKNSKVEYIIREEIPINLLPNLCTIHPDKGRAAKAPNGNEKSMAPNSASSKLK